MGASQADGVRALAAPAVARAGLVLEDLTITPAGKRRVLRVTVDLPEQATGGVPLEAVAEASQALSAALDASDVMGGTPYVLEVSSPGADRPLSERRHWSRARGRLVRARLATAGGEHEARLAEVDDDGVGFEDGARFGWADLAGGRVVLEFTSKHGAEPADDADGDFADDSADDSDDDSDDEQGQEG